jgi:serine/threonine-protein kinase RsbT
MAEVRADWTHPISVSIRDDTHAVVVAQHGRRMAATLGFSLVEQTAFSTALLEIARNIVKYAGLGEITLQAVQEDTRTGIIALACDDGPGISDLELALKDGFSTGKGLGMGLPGARRLVDQFEIASRPGRGTTITLQKWKSAR